MENKQLAAMIATTVRSIMKNTLSLEELTYRESGREDPRYRTFKKHLMEFTYNTTRELFEDLEDLGLIQRVEDDEEDIKNGYRDLESGSNGSGYVNTDTLSKLIQ